MLSPSRLICRETAFHSETESLHHNSTIKLILFHKHKRNRTWAIRSHSRAEDRHYPCGGCAEQIYAWSSRKLIPRGACRPPRLMMYTCLCHHLVKVYVANEDCGWRGWCGWTWLWTYSSVAFHLPLYPSCDTGPFLPEDGVVEHSNLPIWLMTSYNGWQMHIVRRSKH